ncbi:hypothetical protein, partial [Niallia sp. NCCP-28]|uniref:hypothetical protein n=1 Tax=Niallia sp. NCCP-28 TaxID=2934712 RepID=UPI0020BE4B18
MKIGEFGWMPGNSIESTKLTAASNRFQAFFQSLAKSDTVVPVQLPEKVSDGAVSKASLQDLFKVLSNNNVEKLEAVSSTADLEGEKADPINIIHAILNKWDLDSELNENTLHQMAEKVERAFSTVEKQLFHFIHSFSFDEPTENMFAETSLPDLVHALKGIQLAGAETSLLQSQHKVNETVDALANLVSQLINQTSMAAESHENSSNADTAADSMREKNPIMQKLDQSEIEGDIHQKTNETITTKENGAVIATSAKAQAEIAPDSVLATKKETEQTLSPKTNESTASKFVTDKVEQTNQTTADILMQNNDYLLKNGEIIAEDNFFYNSIFLSNEELAGQAGEDALANQKKINTITGENKHAFLSIQSGQQQKNVSIMEENISDLEFEKELNKINSDLLSSLQTENRISPQMTASESIKKSADSHAESVQNKNGKESGLNANAFSTDFVENSGLNEKIIHGDKMAEQLGKALDSKTDQGKTQIEHGRDTFPDTMFLDEAHSVLESSFNLNEKNQPISKKHLGLINQLPNQGEINNTSNLFVSTPSEKPEENSGILMGAFNRKADSRLVQEQEEKAPNPLAANPFGKIGTNERTFMPEGTGRGNQSEQRPKFIQETNPLIQEQEEKAS